MFKHLTHCAKHARNWHPIIHKCSLIKVGEGNAIQPLDRPASYTDFNKEYMIADIADRLLSGFTNFHLNCERNISYFAKSDPLAEQTKKFLESEGLPSVSISYEKNRALGLVDANGKEVKHIVSDVPRTLTQWTDTYLNSKLSTEYFVVYRLNTGVTVTIDLGS